jgi:hypothetical protein
MFLFRLGDNSVEQEFFELLSDKVDSSKLKSLVGYFGSDIYLILSIFEGQYVHFPSYKVLRNIELMSHILKRMRVKESELTSDELRSLGQSLGEDFSKINRLYHKLKEMNLTGEDQNGEKE